MYGDLLNQIAKYLKPKEGYYFLLEIQKYDDTCYLYLIREFAKEVAMEYRIIELYRNLSIERSMKSFIYHFQMDGGLIFGFKTEHYFGLPFLYLSDEKNEINIISWKTFYYYRDFNKLKSKLSDIKACIEDKDKSFITLIKNDLVDLCFGVEDESSDSEDADCNIDHCGCRDYPINVAFKRDLFRVNRENIERIRESLEVLEKIDKFDDFDNIELNEKEKKYIKIY